MNHNIPLSVILEVAAQRAKNQVQLDYVMNYMAAISHLENSYAMQSASK